MITVVVAEDQALVRGALATMLALEPDLDVVGQAATGEEVLEQARRSAPDVVLMDVQMPGMDGLTAADRLRDEVPSCRVLICTTFGRPGYLLRAMDAGAAGFVVKDTPPEQLADAIRRVHSGLRVVDPSLAAESLATGRNPLTERERDVLRAVSSNGTSASIAKAVHLSEGTVRNYLSSVIRKTGARSSAEAVRIADERGWL